MADQGREERAASEGELFRLLVENVVDYAIFVLDPEGLVRSWSHGAERLLGYREDEILGRAADIFFTPEDVRDDIPRLEMRQALDTGRGDDDRWHVRKDGTRFWVSGVMTPLRDEGGRLRGFAKIMRDRTEWWHAEQARQDGERRILSILESITDAFFAVDRDWRFTYLNPQARRLLEPTSGGLLGLSLWEAYPGLAGTEFERSYRRSADERVAVSFTSYYPDHDRWYEVHAYPSQDGLSVYFRDVTEPKRQEEEHARLVAASDRQRRTYETALSNTPDFHYIFDLEGRFTYVNDALLGMWQKGLEEVLGKNLFEIGYPVDLAELHHRKVLEVIATKEPVRGESPFTSHLGERQYDYIFMPVLGAGGAVEAVAGSTRDVTERKEAEDRLRASEARFRQVADTMPQIVWVTRPDGYHEHYNRRWYDYIGCTPEECIGHGWNASLHPDDRQRSIDRWDLALRTGEPYEIEYRFRSKDGEYRWFLGRALPVRDDAGRIVKWFGTCTDIEDMKRAEEEARLSHARFEAVLEAAPVGVYVVDADLRIRLVNPKARPVFGDIEGLIGGDFVEVIHVLWSPAYAAEVVGRFRHTLETGEPSIVPERIEERLDRRVLEYYEWQVHRIVLPGGQYGVVCYFSDISRHVLARRALAESDRRKNEFLATLAHELRNPLAPIRNALLLMRPADGDGEMEAERAMAERNVVHLARLIDDLMDVARISRGQIDLRKEAVDLATVVRQAVQTARPQIDDRRHRLSVSLPEGPTRLEADPTRLEQVFWNLLNNSAKYTDPGGEITLTVEPGCGEVVVRVRDSGIGISPEMLPEVFDMFVQVGDHKARAQGGLGIGLSLVRTLVEMHGGSISAHSDGPGHGSEFVVRLPVLSPTPGVKAPLPDRRGEPAGETPRRRILVVDDNVDAARSLARLLTRVYGQEVRVAHDGPEALAVADDFGPEVVLLDIGLPGMDGNEVARRLRGRPEHRRTLIVALTGWGQEADVARSREAGFDHHLVKPANPDVIRGLLLNSEESEG